MYRRSLTTFRHRRISFEHELIRACAATLSVGSSELGLNRVDVPSMIGCNLVAGRMVLRAFTGAERAQDLERLAIQDVDDRSPSNVQKSLVWREGRRPRLK